MTVIVSLSTYRLCDTICPRRSLHYGK